MKTTKLDYTSLEDVKTMLTNEFNKNIEKVELDGENVYFNIVLEHYEAFSTPFKDVSIYLVQNTSFGVYVSCRMELKDLMKEV